MTESGLREVAESAMADGMTLWDTATVYGMGRSGSLENAPRLRPGLVPAVDEVHPADRRDGDDPVADALERSLTNLGTHHVDRHWIHNPADVERWTPSLIPLLESGKVRHVGDSHHDLVSAYRERCSGMYRRTCSIVGPRGHTCGRGVSASVHDSTAI
ncbi:aldo/keto reductase [Streptomyces millisiae]|uniref:Aldo/keto reductase n=1 Tax=Streptomyces millisiae TaxID=3075542 RepID=A0ABU2LJU7_9ACTN|nr:aldo/keto reductase [Streptomyces sp. DSM 44918]MDT0317861.1 aldo/keto reductase [Streptomyces sp. DSM 44918]